MFSGGAETAWAPVAARSGGGNETVRGVRLLRGNGDEGAAITLHPTHKLGSSKVWRGKKGGTGGRPPSRRKGP